MERKKSITEVGVDDIIKAGLSVEEEAKEFYRILKETIGEAKGLDPREVWRKVVDNRVLKPWHPHGVHQLVYYSVYSHWDSSTKGPPLYWFPSLHESRRANLGRVMEIHGPKLLGTEYKDPIKSFSLFQKFSAEHPEAYWSIVLKELSVVFHEPPKCILDTTDKSKPGGTWLPGSVLNIAECCLQPASHPSKKDDDVAIVWRDEMDESVLHHLKLKEFREQVGGQCTRYNIYKG